MRQLSIIIIILITAIFTFGQSAKSLYEQSGRVSFGESYGEQFKKISEEEEKKEEQLRRVQTDMRQVILERAIDPNEYIVGPGDVFGVDIILMENINKELIISPTGEILIPSVGVVNVDKMTLKEAIKRIESAIKKVYPSADVNVVLVNLRTFQIQIAGAINKPGFYIITSITRLHDIIDLAEGFQQFAREFCIEVIRNDGKVEIINYFNFQLNGDLKSDPSFVEGDRIFVPFGIPDKESVVLRGAISGSGYDIIEPDESLGQFLRRQAKFIETADLENVTITRKESGSQTILSISPADFFSTTLKAGDAIDILAERSVSVNGFVQSPGSFYFFPGYTALDYINMAGGNSIEGDIDRTIVRHLDGNIENISSATLQRGDVIIVPRSWKNVAYGELSVLQIIVSVSTVILTFIAAMK
ncbi:MAG: polysaccharide biosynthesis/export family protein [Candidatus Marinimicrobia bacterium]|jgi:protein involved in polysaccharide export with SLBB domain|nr:polysaccharide biosynthesis/export family protein [Candidatus Neomarinimicrobiota bacterium]MCK9559072.1 polysaccharide biosynthesis/export family protein [Candidatus Neomarinimicrobiota bacterium]